MSEITNADRAGWAQVGVEAYAAETRFDPREQVIVKGDQDDKDHAEEVISDLLCDMHHLTDSLGINWEAMLERAAMHHRDDVAEERIHESKNLTAEIKDLLAPDPWGQAETADARKRHAQERLEYLRGELQAERISTGELIELQNLVPYIEPGDVQLLEAAGVPEFPEGDK